MQANKLLNFFYKKKIRFFSGVPDSCTGPLANTLLGLKNNKFSHLIAPNEGTAVSLGVGHYLSTKQIPCIYMQNSGLGNATDPLTNLCHKTVYEIPLILLIGWRGKPGLHDEPQHVTQGKTLCSTLKSYGIRYYDANKLTLKKFSNVIDETKKKNQITAILIDKNYFGKVEIKNNLKSKKIYRSVAIQSLLNNLRIDHKIISSTGFNSREILFQDKNNHKKSFYLVGAMGHTLAVSLGALNNTSKTVVCVDGDGSFYMHLGSFSLLKKEHNLIYYFLDNSSHESVGDVKLNYRIKDIKKFSKSVGFKKYIKVTNLDGLNILLKGLKKIDLPIFIHILTGIEHNIKLPRPSEAWLKKIKKDFLKK